MRKLYSYDEITKNLKDVDEAGDASEIVIIKQLPQYLFTHNAEMKQCDVWVTNGVSSYEESLYQLVNLLPLNGEYWDNFKNEELLDYTRILYMGWFHSTLPEELTFQV